LKPWWLRCGVLEVVVLVVGLVLLLVVLEGSHVSAPTQLRVLLRQLPQVEVVAVRSHRVILVPEDQQLMETYCSQEDLVLVSTMLKLLRFSVEELEVLLLVEVVEVQQITTLTVVPVRHTEVVVPVRGILVQGAHIMYQVLEVVDMLRKSSAHHQAPTITPLVQEVQEAQLVRVRLPEVQEEQAVSSSPSTPALVVVPMELHLRAWRLV
ncbi:hypothetical protein KC906_02695, partial [Candidatus Kaiserbacteria bacterium]|nr:hypothetical protein [Candidatus Kaiserbacteria bacterium]